MVSKTSLNQSQDYLAVMEEFHVILILDTYLNYFQLNSKKIKSALTVSDASLYNVLE